MAWNVVATLTLSSTPYGVAYGNGYVYIANTADNTVSVIDAATNTVTTTVTVELLLAVNEGLVVASM